MDTWSFYSTTTGVFSGKRYSGPKDSLAANTPAGCVAIVGAFDRFTQRVEVATGQVIVDDSLAAGRDEQRRRDGAVAAIAELERQQLRPTRELLIDPNNGAADTRLRALDEQIAKLREELT